MYKKYYAINLVRYTEENVPECCATIFVTSEIDITKIPSYIIKENIKEEIEKNECEGIGDIYEMSEEEVSEEHNADLITLSLTAETVQERICMKWNEYLIEIERYFGGEMESIKMDDFQAPPIGTKGTVRCVDDTGSILVRWNNGSGFNVIYGEDVCRKIEREDV